MLKSIFYVVLMLVSVNNCRYTEDSCHARGKTGTCKVLSDCFSVHEEIMAAGHPMPLYIRKKLQEISCGYESYNPMVCCNDNPSDDNKPNTNNDLITNWNDNPKGSERPPLVDTDNDRKIETKTGDDPPNVQRHRNLRLLPTDCGSTDAERISGGNRTALYEMPWMVLLSYDKERETSLGCGGTLINRWYVLTAAHCIAFLGQRMKLQNVILGEYDVRTDPDCETYGKVESCAPLTKTVGIAEAIPHPGYRPATLVDDIGLIRLSEPADFSLDTMKPICLPSTPELQREYLVGQFGTVTGWGVTEIGLQSPVLLKVALPVITNEDCQAAYRGSPRVHPTQMCAGGEIDKDSCGGDSGGPLMYPGKVGSAGVRYVQRGVVSYGSKRCGVGGFPGVYTNVAYYMDWILDNITS